MVVILSQSEFAYNYVKMPLEVWRHISEENIRTEKSITISTVPENFLQDSDILQNFVSRYEKFDILFLRWMYMKNWIECREKFRDITDKILGKLRLKFVKFEAKFLQISSANYQNFK